METSFAARRYGKPLPVARHIGLQSYRNAALLSLAQAARATISLMSNAGAMIMGALADRRMGKVCQAWVY
jgi:hypothetical protein